MKKQNGIRAEIPKITIEEINKIDSLRNLSEDQKIELILFVYQLSLVLYNSYCHEDE